MKDMPPIQPLKLLGSEDKLFASSRFPKPFTFDEQVARVFDNMVARSIPLYREVIANLLAWAVLFQQRDGYIYDIGCSTGTTILALAEHLEIPATFIGLDSSQAMLKKAQEKLQLFPARHRWQLRCQDACEADYTGAHLVVINYTLQFIPVAHRKLLLAKVCKGLRSGGLLFFSEKIRSSFATFQEAMTWSYENFKAANGYSRNEIERKKEALDEVLVPLTLDEYMLMLRECGFCHVEPVIKWNQFVSIVAVKE